MEEKQPGRLRTSPAERFAGSSHVLDLNKALEDLRAEAHDAKNGHRQKTVFHRAPVAKVLFSFDEGGALPDHSAHGTVSIHVLEGRFEVQADGHNHELGANQILVLHPDVAHDVRAVEAGAMLLTVHREST